MSTPGLRITITALLLTGFISACSSPHPLGSSVPPPPFPPRPVGIDVRSLEPCSMLSDAQQDELGIRRPTNGAVDVDGLRSPVCTWLGVSMINTNVQIIPADAASSTRLPGARLTQINGFGAVENVVDSGTGGGPICQAAIDVSPGYTIRVQVLTPTKESAPPIDEICRRATDVASKVMTTVVATAAR